MRSRLFAGQLILGVPCVLLVLCVASAFGAPSAPKWRVETADARVLTGDIVAISTEKITLRTADGPRELRVMDVVEMSAGDRPDDVLALPGQAVIRTAQGDALAVDRVACDGRRLTATGDLLGRIEIPVDSARAILLPGPGRTAAQLIKAYDNMALSDPAGDRILVARPDKQDLPVDGVLEAIDAAKVTFRWQDQSRTVSRGSVSMILLASVAAKSAGPTGTLIARDSSHIRFTSIRLADGQLVLDTPAAGTLSIALSDAASIHVATDQVVRLADLEPVAVKEHGLFALTFKHRVNKSVGGRPLTMAGRRYASGIGTHSFCELQYDLAGKYSTFVALVGIDDEARPRGDAAVTFLADGKAVGEPLRVTGADKPRQVRVSVKGAKRLTIRVDFGADGLGVGDHVDFASARLVK